MITVAITTTIPPPILIFHGKQKLSSCLIRSNVNREIEKRAAVDEKY